MKLIDIIVPCYNEEEVLPLFIEETNKVIATIPDYDFRYIFVNDGSKDRTLEVMRALAEKYDGSRDEMAEDVRSVISKLRKIGAIVE